MSGELHEAAADSFADMAAAFVCEPETWPVFKAWCEENNAHLAGHVSPATLSRIRGILTRRAAESIVRVAS